MDPGGRGKERETGEGDGVEEREEEEEVEVEDDDRKGMTGQPPLLSPFSILDASWPSDDKAEAAAALLLSSSAEASGRRWRRACSIRCLDGRRSCCFDEGITRPARLAP